MKAPVILAIVVLAFTGCTVTPDRVTPASASYDNGEANSGVLALEKDGAFVTARLVERYRALLGVYESAFVPRVKPAEGVTKRPDGTFFITNEVLERMILLTEWRRMGRKPD
jgi:hypothetical protein